MPWRDPNAAVEGTLWGRVVDAVTGDPIDGAVVQVGSLDPAETDGNGYYVVTLIPAAAGGTPYDISAASLACPEVIVADIVVMPGEVVRQDIDLCAIPLPGDMDQDGDVDSDDLPAFLFCMQGPEEVYGDTHFCRRGDADEDADVDLADLGSFQRAFGGN